MSLRHKIKNRDPRNDALVAKAKLIRAGCRVDNISSDAFVLALYERIAELTFNWKSTKRRIDR
jgi:hypothetical protein